MAFVESKSKRIIVIDAMRGLAIALMILDHSLAVIEERGYVLSIVEYSRLSITRFAMPLFMIASGLLWATKGLRISRWLQVLMWAAVINTATRLLWPEFNYPEILLIWSSLAVFWKLIVRFPLSTMIIGYTQITFWSAPWSGYQPGELAIFLGAGVLLSRAPIEKIWRSRKPERLLVTLAAIGRYPLSIYGGHLLLLTLIVGSMNNRLSGL
jgi:uncharacterized membrane protein